MEGFVAPHALINETQLDVDVVAVAQLPAGSCRARQRHPVYCEGVAAVGRLPGRRSLTNPVAAVTSPVNATNSVVTSPIIAAVLLSNPPDAPVLDVPSRRTNGSLAAAQGLLPLAVQRHSCV
jgi:hypothetical protein